MFKDLKPDDCRKCWGCGKIATDEDESPWVVWAEMPLQSALAVTMGLVQSRECPECGGTGKREPPTPRSKVMSNLFSERLQALKWKCRGCGRAWTFKETMASQMHYGRTCGDAFCGGTCDYIETKPPTPR